MRLIKDRPQKTQEQLKKEVIRYMIVIAVFAAFILLIKPIRTNAEISLNNIFKFTNQAASVITGNELAEEDATLTDYITDPIIEAMGETLYNSYIKILPIFVKFLGSTFEPSLNPLFALENTQSISVQAIAGTAEDMGADADILNDFDYSDKTMDDSVVMSSIWQFSVAFGIITATLIALFNLLLCVLGRSEEIRDTPLMIVTKYIIALVLIFISKPIINSVIDFFGSAWTNLIWHSDLIAGDYDVLAAFMPIRRALDVVNNTNVDTVTAVGSVAGSAGATLIIFGMAFPAVSGAAVLAVIVLLIIGIILSIKLIKELLKLYLEIVERYFVLFILLAFFPILASTLTSNNSKKVFVAYIKMLWSQFFLLIVNTILMSVFCFILFKGGWCAGFLNYLAALAFLRVCQRIDAYMAQLGLNVVQTGAGLAGAIGGAGSGFLSAMKGLSTLNRGRKNIGAGIADKGIRTNNAGMAAAGKAFGAGLRDVVSGGLSTQGMSQTIMNQQAQHIANVQGHAGAGRTGSISNGVSANNANGSWGSVQQSMKDFGVSDVQASKMCNDLQQAGYMPSDISSIQQNDANATSFTVGGENGAFATFNGMEPNPEIRDVGAYTADGEDRKSMALDGVNEAQEDAPDGFKTYDKGDASRNIEGAGISNSYSEQLGSFLESSGDSNALRREAARSGELANGSTQVTTTMEFKKGDSSEGTLTQTVGNVSNTYEVKSVAAHPEVLNDPNYRTTVVNTNNGKHHETVGIRKQKRPKERPANQQDSPVLQRSKDNNKEANN